MPDPIQPLQTPESTNDTAMFLAKVIVSMFAAPKLSALLTKAGIQVDSTAATMVLATVLHKIHDIVKNQTGWKWL